MPSHVYAVPERPAPFHPASTRVPSREFHTLPARFQSLSRNYLCPAAYNLHDQNYAFVIPAGIRLGGGRHWPVESAPGAIRGRICGCSGGAEGRGEQADRGLERV